MGNNIIEYYIQVIAEGNITDVNGTNTFGPYYVDREIYCLDIANAILASINTSSTTQWVDINDDKFFELTIEYDPQDTSGYCDITSILAVLPQ